METRVNQILQIVDKNPGISYSEILRETGFAHGVLSHHLSKIEKSGKIQIQRTPRVARVYLSGIQEQEAQLIKNLRNTTIKKIIVSLLDRELSFKEITEKAGKSQGTISSYLKDLTEQNIIHRKLHNTELIFDLVDAVYIRDIISKHKTSLFERSADNIADIFSSL